MTWKYDGGGPIGEPNVPGDPYRMQVFADHLKGVHEWSSGRAGREDSFDCMLEIGVHVDALKRRCPGVFDPAMTPRLSSYAMGMPLHYNSERGDWSEMAREFAILAARVVERDLGRSTLEKLRPLDRAVLDEIIKSEVSLTRKTLVDAAAVWKGELRGAGRRAIIASVDRLLETVMIEEPDGLGAGFQPTVRVKTAHR